MLIYEETTLTVNQIKKSERLKWRSDFDRLDQEAVERTRSFDYQTEKTDKYQTIDQIYSTRIKIKPAEIRTFLIFLENPDELQ